MSEDFNGNTDKIGDFYKGFKEIENDVFGSPQKVIKDQVENRVNPKSLDDQARDAIQNQNLNLTNETANQELADSMNRAIEEGYRQGDLTDAEAARERMIDADLWPKDEFGNPLPPPERDPNAGNPDGDETPPPGGDSGGGSSWGDWAEDVWEDVKDYFSPLVIDLDGDGIELVSLEDSTAYFDLNINGYAQHTGWVNADDGLLAFDANGNGVIDDNSELFGNMTGFQNGFLQLENHDENGDGVINSSDTAYSSLLVWQDADQDGFSDAGELISLSDAGIASIDLNSTSVSEYNAGHWISDRSSVTLTDGTARIIEDVHFENDQSSSYALLDDDFEYDLDAYLLPTLWGVGQISSTWVALTLDDDLKAQSFALLAQLQSGDIKGFREDFETFLLDWAGVADTPAGSRGSHIDARHLAFMEAASGDGFVQEGSANPQPDAGEALEELFDRLVDQFAGRFMSQAVESTALLDAFDIPADDYAGQYDAIAAAVNSHPLFDFYALAENYLPDTPALQGDVSDLVAGLSGQVESGVLTVENALLSLSLVQQDVQPDAAQFVVDAVAGATSAGLSPTSDFVLLLENYRDIEVSAGNNLDDILISDGSATFFVAGDGNDQITGSDLGDIYYGGNGDDNITGGDGADTYLYKLGDGNDVIADWDNNHVTDKLILADVNADDVSFASNGGEDLIITFSNGETIRIIDHFSETQHESIEIIEFADGTTMSLADIRNKSVADQKASGSIIGSDLSETYYHTLGDGSYTIADWDNNHREDRLVLTDVNADDVTFASNGGEDLIITFSNGETITFIDHFEEADDETLEVIEFADGSTMNLADIRNKSVADQKASGSIIGSDFAETYYHALGDGSYTIADWDNNHREDRLVLTDVNANDVTFASNGAEDLIITFSNGETIRFIDHFEEADDETLEVIEFADGSTVNLAEIRNKSVADQKASGSIIGSDFAETYHHSLGDGSYTIADWDNNNRQDKLVLTDVNVNDVTFASNSGEDLTITFSNGETIRVIDHFTESQDESIEVIQFADGGSMNLADIRNKSVADQKASGSVIGSDFAETYYHTLGDGSYTVTDWDNNSRTDEFVFTDVNSTDVTIQRLGSDHDDVVFTLSNGDQITFNEQANSNDDWGMEQFIFADGVTLTRQQIETAPIVEDSLVYV